MADRDATVRRLRYTPAAAATVAIVFGVLVLEGYFFGLGSAYLPPTDPLIAVLFVLTGMALFALRLDFVPLEYGTAGAATLIAAMVLIEYALGVSLGIDTLLFPDAVAYFGGAFPGRPPPISAAVFFLTGLLLLPIRIARDPVVRRARLAAVIGAVLLPVMALAGHLFGVPELYALAPGVAIALHATLALFLLALGVALSTHEPEVTALLLARDPSTVLLRRLLPLAVMLPLLFAAGSIHALRLGIYQVHIGLLLYVALFIGLSLAAAFWVARIVRQADAERAAADRANAELALTERLLLAEEEAVAAVKDSERRTRELLEVLGHAA
ncbi:MAG: hypothetical protein H0T68_03790, partial [Gemmatimonadales bacterium]|nr:hypothetical protein [Gemmatimonadales bacterium]